MAEPEPTSLRGSPEPAQPGPTRLRTLSEPLLREAIGEALRRERLRQRRTLREVAEEAQVSLAFLSEIERGRKEASSEVLAAVSRALGLRLIDLVARTGRELQTVLALAAAPAPVRLVPARRLGSTGARDALLLAA